MSSFANKFNIEVYFLSWDNSRHDLVLKGESVTEYIVHNIIEQYGDGGYENIIKKEK